MARDRRGSREALHAREIRKHMFGEEEEITAMEQDVQRRNPSRRARPSGGSSEDPAWVVRGRSSTSPQSVSRGDDGASGSGAGQPVPPPRPPGRGARFHSDIVGGRTSGNDVEIEGRCIDPRFGQSSPTHSGMVLINRHFRSHPQFDAKIVCPSNPGHYMDYSERRRAGDLRLQRLENPYLFVRDDSVDRRFWSRFQQDYYMSIIWKCFCAKREATFV